MNDARLDAKIDEIYGKVNEIAETLARLTANHEHDHSQITEHEKQIRFNNAEIGNLQKAFAKIDGQVALMKLLTTIAVAAGTLGAFVWQIWK